MNDAPVPPPREQAPAQHPEQLPEQLRYARWLDIGGRIGLLVLVLSFAAYVAGIGQPQVPVDRLPALWSLPVADFLAASGMASGWGWVGQLGHSDVVGLAGIAMLAGCSLPALLALVPLYLRRGDKAFAVLCVAQALVLLLAASGLPGGGH